ncbi:MAG: hypothetical protein ACJZ9F_10580 [Rhodospirillaceae bacterium]
MEKKYSILTKLLVGTFILACNSYPAMGFDWAVTEFQSNFGVIDTPTFAGGGDNSTVVFTIEHSDGWAYGDNYFFIDLAKSTTQFYNKWDIYAEYYANFSFSKIKKRKFSKGILADIGVIAGINWDLDAKVVKYLPGIRFGLSLPGFDFANLDITAYIDDNAGLAKGGAPKQGDSVMVDFNWGYPFSIGKLDFAVNGHLEYIHKRRDTLGNQVASHVLNQEQIRWDIGKALNGTPGRVFIGLELSIWINKLGDRMTDEFAPQALFAYRF